MRRYYSTFFAKFLVMLVLVSGQVMVSNAIESKNKTRINSGWEFMRGDLGSPLEAFREGKNAFVPKWSEVTLPHSYNAKDAVDPDVNIYQGPAWYRLHLEIKNPFKGGRTLLHFEGAGQKTEVYIYTQKVESHDGGYDEFEIDITDAVEDYIDKYGQPEKGIPVAIRTDNSRDVQLVPSDLSDFNVYGGIYRYLNLVYVPEAYLKHVHIKADLQSDLKLGEISIKANVFSPESQKEALQINGVIVGPDGKILENFSTEIEPGESSVEFYNGKFKKPELWSPDNPNLYTCEITLITESGKQIISEEFGFRNFEFIKKGPFYLNGERLLLKGTHRHEDHADVGPAMTEELINKEMEMMKSMGVNFIRLGHYQQSRIVLEACDRLGILVWEEIPWCRGGLGGEYYQNTARQMLRNMISQHYNHPSVIIWGLGNENDWPGDFEEFDKEKIRNFMSELNQLSHKLDPSRKTAIRRCDFCKDIVDVYSPSIWAGWYRGKYTDYLKVSRKNWEEVDHFLHVEWGASNHARRHSPNPDQGLDKIASSENADERAGDFLMKGGAARVSKDGDWTESYAVNLIDWHLKEQEKMDWLTGTAYWPFKDFSTPLRSDNPVPYVNQKGVVERDFTKKEGFYVFQSYWTEEPMVHIYGHSWPVRWSVENEDDMIKVYSNCPTAELFLNGKTVGKRKRDSQDFPAAGLRWKVNFIEGKNVISVKATKNGKIVEEQLTINYQTQKWEKPAKFILEEVERKNDTVTIRAIVQDNWGVPCLDAKDFVRFGITGDGSLIDNQGTSIGARKVQLYNGRALIKIKMNGGNSAVSVSSENIPTKFLKLKSKTQTKSDEAKTDLIKETDLLKMGFKKEEFTYKDFIKWESFGMGEMAQNHEQTVLRETEGSKGYMLVSPEIYGKNTIVSFDVMALNAASVLILEMAAHNKKKHELKLDDGYDGNVKYLFENINMYMFAFHNAAHNKTGPFVRKYPLPGAEPLISATKNRMQAGKYYHVVIGMQDGELWFYIDGKQAWKVKDPHAYEGGKIILRIRGTAHELASCLIKNLNVYSK